MLPAPLIMALTSFFNFKYMLIHHPNIEKDDSAVETAKSFLSDSLQSTVYAHLEGCLNSVNISHRRSAVLTMQGMVPMEGIDHSQIVWILPDLKYVSINKSLLRYDSMIVTYSKAGSIVQLKEWYSLNGGRLEWNKIGSWDVINGFVSLADHYMWKRRRDLHAAPLRYLILPWPNFTTLKVDADGKLKDIGLYNDVLMYLKDYLNFTLEVSLPKDGEWGYQSSDGFWTGIVGELVRGECDVSSGLTISKERSEVIDFTMPMFNELVTLVIHKTYDMQIVDSAAYVKIFLPNVWLSIFGILVLVGIGSLAMALGHSGHKLFVDCHVISLSGKVMIVTINLFSFFLFSHYASDLTSTMTTGPIPTRITSFQDVFDSGNYRVMVVEGGNAHHRFLKAKEGSAMNKIYQKMLRDKRGSFMEDGPELRERFLNDPDSAAFTHHLTFVHDGNHVTALVDLAEAARTQQAFGLQKDSELREVLSYYLLKMSELGTLEQVVKRHFGTPPQDRSKRIFTAEELPGAIAPANVAILAVILLGGAAVAILLACVEKALVNDKAQVVLNTLG